MERVRVGIWLILVVGALATILVTPLAANPLGQFRHPVRASLSEAQTADLGPAFSESSIAAQVSNIDVGQCNLAHVPQACTAGYGSPTAEAAKVSSIMSATSLVQVDPSFVDALAAQGSSDVTLQLLASFARGVEDANVNVNWEANGLAYTEYWDVNLTTESIVGPLTQAFPTGFGGSYYYSPAWSGWDFRPGVSVADINGQINSMPTISTPPQSPCCIPSGNYAHPVAAPWVGISPNQFGGGGQGLMQGGVEYDVSTGGSCYGNPCYLMWYEYFCAPNCNGQYMQFYSPSGGYVPIVPPGQADIEQVIGTSSTSNVYDVNQIDISQHHTFSMPDSNDPSGWSPTHAFLITEAFYETEGNGNCGGNSCIQQIAQLSSAVRWDNCQIEGWNADYDCAYLYNHGYADIYQLNQWCAEWVFGSCSSSGDNTNQNYESSESFQMSWVTSSYDWNCVNGGETCHT